MLILWKSTQKLLLGINRLCVFLRSLRLLRRKTVVCVPKTSGSSASESSQNAQSRILILESKVKDRLCGKICLFMPHSKARHFTLNKPAINNPRAS